MKKEKEKLLILSTWYPPVNGIFVEEQALLLSEKYEVVVITHAFSYIPKKSILTEKLKVYRYDFPYIPKRFSIGLKMWKSLLSAYAAKIIEEEKPDLIMGHNYLSGIILKEVKRKIGIEYMLTLHSTSLFKGTYPDYLHSEIKSSLKIAKKVIVVGKGLQKSVRGAFDIDSIVVPNFIDMSKFSISNSKYDGVNFVVIGGLEKDDRKGLFIILEAFSILKDENIKLHIIGDCKDMSQEQVGKNVTLHGRQPNGKLVEILKKSHCLVSMSNLETFGITLIEAMACGLPVIYCDNGASEYLVPEIGGINISRNSVMLVEKMHHVIDNINTYIPNEIRESVISKYSKNEYLKQIDSIISDFN